MFGENITLDLSAGERGHREKFVREDPAGFVRAERSIQKAWEAAIDLAEAKLRVLGVTDDRSIMICLHFAIAVEMFAYIDDPRFQVKTPDNKAYTPVETPVFGRAVKVVEQLAQSVWREGDTCCDP